MSWKKEVDELAARRAMAETMGGAEKVARQHSRGKMDARARLDAIVDPGSFREIGKIAGRGTYGPDGALEDLAASNFIFGRANIDGRPVVASADRSEEHTSELQSLMRISYAVFCLKKKTKRQIRKSNVAKIENIKYNNEHI